MTEMTFRRLVTTLIFTLAITHVCIGQQSAQATMQVQVTVVEGNSISSAHNSTIDLSNSASLSGLSEIMTMKFNVQANTPIVLSRPDKLDLQDDEGRHLDIPLIYSDTLNDKDITTKVDTNAIPDTESNRGVYKGSLTTAVIYL